MAETTPETAHTSTASDGKSTSSLKFFKGGVNILSDDGDNNKELVQRELTKALSAKNLSFLLGAGCSSYITDDGEKGVPTMKPLAEEFIRNKNGELEDDDPFKRIVECGVRLEHFNHNLEDLLQILFSLLLFVKRGRGEEGKTAQDAIKQITDYLFNKINLSKGDEVLNLYQSLYKRIFFRDRSLPRPWVFTTNYDLLNEHALDATQIFERIAKEGRKYGMFLMVASQRPSELSRTVLSQCANFIIHRIQNPDDLSHIRQMTPFISKNVLERLPSLPKQNALIFGNAVTLPTTFKVREASPLPKSDDANISEAWFRDREEQVPLNLNN